MTHGETMFKYGIFVGYSSMKARRMIAQRFPYSQRMARFAALTDERAGA